MTHPQQHPGETTRSSTATPIFDHPVPPRAIAVEAACWKTGEGARDSHLPGALACRAARALRPLPLRDWGDRAREGHAAFRCTTWGYGVRNDRSNGAWSAHMAW